MKSKGLGLLLAVLSVVSAAGGCAYGASAQEAEGGRMKQLEAQVLANPKDSSARLKELAGLYFSAGEYNQFAEFLGKLKTPSGADCGLGLGYYTGLCRYHQLRYLEEKQDWKEYFDNGGSYRQELFRLTEEEVSLCPNSPFAIRAQIINWLEHKARNDAEAEGSLNKVISLINGYVKQPQAEDIEVIKEAADTLAREKETAFSKAVYNIYVNRMIAKEVSIDKLRQGAQEAYDQGNLELSQALYDRYLQLASGFFPKEKLAGELAGLAREFAYGTKAGNSDPYYAEKTFSVLKETAGADYFSQELQYLRAYNLQGMKEYYRSAQEYEELVSRFPSGALSDKALFKLGLLYTYILGQREKGLSSWQKVIERDNASIHALESRYHKSLISQYEGKTEEAKAGYEKISQAIAEKGGFSGLAGRVSLRQKEIAEAREIEYNLKMFLDSVLKEGALNQSPLELLLNPPKSGIGQEVKFRVQQPMLQTGCFAPELAYLWSGDLGDAAVTPVEPGFVLRYPEPGVKAVNLVVSSPAGIVGSAVVMVEIDE